MSVFWNILDGNDMDSLSESLRLSVPKLNYIVSQLFVRRGIYDKDSFSQYVRPTLSQLHDPFLMTDMQKAVTRLNEAVAMNQKIMIYGDYDVDGTTSVALIYRFLRETVYTDKFLNFYIPDRYDEGYGITKKGIDIANLWGAKLIIALDCGAKAHEEIEYAKSLGIDFIICDHHQVDDMLPDAVAMLNPMRQDDNYPFKYLSGCGVGYKLLQAFSISNNINIRYLNKHLELVALSIAADLVPVTGENRIFAYHGVRQLNSSPSIGVKGIIQISNLENKYIDMNSISFKMSPRINASGRMMNGSKTVELLISKDAETVKEKSREIESFNQERRELDTIVTKEAVKNIQRENLTSKKIIVVYNDNWHKGVIGIVASRLTDLYSKPVIVLTRDGDTFCGSARSVSGIDLYKAVENSKDLLSNFGGHPYAVGMMMPAKNIDVFKAMIEEFAEDNFATEEYVQNITIDACIDIDKITPKLLSQLKLLSPFGVGNEEPVFMSKVFLYKNSFKNTAKDSKHLFIEIPNRNRYYKRIFGFAYKQSSSITDKKDGFYQMAYTIQDISTETTKEIKINIRKISEYND